MTTWLRRFGSACALTGSMTFAAGCSGSSPEGAQQGRDAGSDGGPSDGAAGEEKAADTGTPPEASLDGAAPGDAGMDADAFSVVTVSLSGCSAFSYFAPVSLGGSQSLQLLFDTGSTTLAVASSSCTDCGVSPVYTPGPPAVDQHQTASSIYGGEADGGGPGWTGEIYQDTASVGGSPAASATMDLVAIDTQNQFFLPASCGTTAVSWQGIVGFAPGMDAIPGTNGYFDRLIAGGSVPNVFAAQLCDPGGYLWLGGYDPAHVMALPQYTPFSTSVLSVSSYVVDLEQVGVDGTMAEVHAGPYVDTLLDTGSNAFYLPPAAFATVTGAIESSAGFDTIFGADAGASFFSASSCPTLTQTAAQLDALLPPMTLVFGTNPAVSVVATATESYLVPVGGGMWCTGILSNAPNTDFPFVADMGSTVLRSNVVIFDRANQRVGFAPHGPCP